MARVTGTENDTTATRYQVQTWIDAYGWQEYGTYGTSAVAVNEAKRVLRGWHPSERPADQHAVRIVAVVPVAFISDDTSTDPMVLTLATDPPVFGRLA